MSDVIDRRDPMQWRSVRWLLTKRGQVSHGWLLFEYDGSTMRSGCGRVAQIGELGVPRGPVKRCRVCTGTSSSPLQTSVQRA